MQTRSTELVTHRHAKQVDLTHFRRDELLEELHLRGPVVKSLVYLTLIGFVGALGVGWWYQLDAGTYLLVLASVAIAGFCLTRIYMQLWPMRCSECGCPLKRCFGELRPEHLSIRERATCFAAEAAGRYFAAPTGENDDREWVKLMMRVHACRECRTYVWRLGFHEQDCTHDELEFFAANYGGPTRHALKQLFGLVESPS